MKLKTLVGFLNKELDVENIRDESLNGMQVEGGPDVRKVGFAVDAAMATIKKAKKEGCDILIVHHGLFWKTIKPMSGILGRRVKAIFDSGMTLYAVHLPLDSHPKYGNNIQLAKLFGLKNLKRFADYKGQVIGYKGTIPSTSVSNFVMTMRDKLDSNVSVYDQGKEKISTIGISSGGSAFSVHEAIEAELDALMIGESGHSHYHEFLESGINIFVGGHYATETWGLKALQKLLEKKFKVKTVFIDMPTRL